MEGKFILFEGLTCSGKTTLAEMLVGRLQETGVKAIFNHEPTKTLPYGMIVRHIVHMEEKHIPDAALLQATREHLGDNGETNILLSRIIDNLLDCKPITDTEVQILYIADRGEDIQHIIMPALNEGKWVIQDRYDLSTFAYGMGIDLPFEDLLSWHHTLIGDEYKKPDMIFYIDIKPETAIERLRASGKIVDIFETYETQKKIRDAYLRLIKDRHNFKNVFVIDGQQSLDAILQDILDEIRTYAKVKL
ncbi:MAG: dTMP kinase [Parcubacteria group bacterium]|nr:dTMP kinase [Parcubacteria group bacterium]